MLSNLVCGKGEGRCLAEHRSGADGPPDMLFSRDRRVCRWAAAQAWRSAAKRGIKRESSIEYETMEPQEMIDGLVQVLREVYANDTF
jgi:hypothetical protein